MDKLEKHIKKQLQNREISPSPEAWEKIAVELKSETSTAPKRTYWWAIAAGIVGLIVLSTQFFDPQDPIETPRETIVVQEETNNKEIPEISDGEDSNPNLERQIEDLVLEVPLNEQQDPEPKTIGNPIQIVEREAPENQESLNDVAEVTDLAITSKLEEVLAQVNSMEDGSIAVSDKEIDSLLMAAQRELLAENILGEDGKIDAMALLDEVEMEIYDDEQNPLFIRLKEGFFKLRTAVADRNN